MPSEFFRNYEYHSLAFYFVKQYSLMISPFTWIRKDYLLTLKRFAHKFKVFLILSSTLGSRWDKIGNWQYLEEIDLGLLVMQ